MKNTSGKKGLKRLLITASAVVLLTAATAAFAAMPKGEVVLSKDVITLGDVFSGLSTGVDAGHVLAPAPAYGQSVTLNAHDLKRISEAFNLGWMPSGGMDRTTLRRDARFIDRYQIEAEVQEKLSEQLSGQKFDIEMADRDMTVQLPASEPATMELANIKTDLSKGEFRAVLLAPSADRPLIRKEVTGRIYAMTSVPMLSRSLRAGDVITADDIQYVDMRTSDVSANVIVNADKIIGQTPRRGVQALRQISAADIEMPEMVKKGDVVTMTLSNGIIQLTAQGRAMQNGSAGDVVRVVNTSSNQTVEAIVTGDRTVAVKSPDAALDQNI